MPVVTAIMKNQMTRVMESIQLFFGFVCWILKLASCIQRTGRVGRVSNGFCFRLVPEKFFISNDGLLP